MNRRISKQNITTRELVANNSWQTTRNKIPRWINLAEVGNDPGMVGNIILDMSTRRFCYHNGLRWVCLPDGGSAVTLSGVPGTGILVASPGGGVGPALAVKTLVAGPGVTLTPTGTTLTITASASGSGASVAAPFVTFAAAAGLLDNRILTAGTGISIINSGVDDGPITISADASTVTLTNRCSVADGNLVAIGTGPNLAIKGLVAGLNISLTSDASCITIASTSPVGTTVTLNDIGLTGTSLIGNHTGPDLTLKTIKEGSGVNFTDDGTCIIISTNLAAGTGIDLTFNGTLVTISADASALNTNVTLNDVGLTGTSLIGDHTGPDLTIKRLKEGSGINLADDGTCVVVSTNLAAGTGIDLIFSGTLITIAADASALNTNVTLSTDGTCDCNLVLDGSGPDLIIRGLEAGEGITLTEVASCCRIEVDDDDFSLSTTCLGGSGTGSTMSLVGTGVQNISGINLTIRGLAAGSGITLTGDPSCVTISSTVHTVQNISTRMRTESTSISFGGIVGSVTFTDPCLGTLNGAGGATGGSIVTYTPLPRVPRYPERKARDSFSFSGEDAAGNTVIGIVNVCIECICPDAFFIVNPTGTTEIDAVNVGSLIQTNIIASGGGNSMATNNIDGIVFSFNNGTGIRFWDPVTDATGIIAIDGVENFQFELDSTGGATFDNDRGQYLIFNDSSGTAADTMWYYRISFDPFETNTTPVIKTISQVRLYTDFRLSTAFTSSLGDSAWDPISKRVYIMDTSGTLYYIYPYDMRWTALTTGGTGTEYMGQASQVITQTATGTALQITFNCDGSRLFGQVTSAFDVYEIDRVPPTATLTLLGTATGGSAGALDAAVWPCTLSLP